MAEQLAHTPDPGTQADRLFAAGLAFHQEGALEQALARYEQALQHAPRHFDALHHIGILAWQAGDHEVALQFLGAAIEVDGAVGAAHSNLGNVLKAGGRHAEALASYDTALALDGANADAHYNRGNTLHALGRLDDALGSYQRAIALQPGDAEAHLNCAAVLDRLGRPEAALRSYEAALGIDPGNAVAHGARAVVLEKLGRMDAALAGHERALALDGASGAAWLNYGNTLRQLRRFEAALDCYARADALQGASVQSWVNRGLVHGQLGQFDAALDCFGQAGMLDPAHHAPPWNKALLYLRHARLAEGWPGYERRWEAGRGAARRHFDRPQWRGQQALAGKTILLHAEQGLGDTLQFCRYAQLVADLGARVILEVQRPLAGLLAGLPGAHQVVARGEPLPPFDLQCPLLSLPLAFRTTLATIPAAPRYLQADPARVAQWSAVLGPRTAPRIGIAWSGNPDHTDDYNRSIAFERFARALPGRLELVALQKDIRPGDAAALAAHGGVRQFGERLHDFDDTAALCELMDLVIAVDTSIAHLAGALGKPLWLLLAANADWRWMLERGDSPWYPGATLYRQDPGGGWDPVLERVRIALGAMFEE